jgi:hypothetical protein
MNELDISKAIQYLKPNAEFSFEGTDYSTIKWDVLEGSAPTWLEIETAHQAIKTAELQAEAEATAKRQALLDKLGITEDEARLLLGGN